MKNFLSGISVIKQGAKGMKENDGQNKRAKKSENTSLDNDIEHILLDSKKEEDIIFYHYGKSNLIKLEIGNKTNSNPFVFLEYDIFTEDDKLVLDEKEMEEIKTYHVLNVLKPKIEQYLTYKNIDFNCTFMRNIYSYADEIGFENTIGYLLPLIQDLSFRKNKYMNIVVAFLDTFEKLLVYLKQYDTDHSIIISKLLPIISQILIAKKDMNLINKAVKCLKFLMDNITKDECMDNVIPILIEMASSENNELGQTIAIQIFSDKASFLGGETIELYVLPMFQSLSENSNDNLRIYCIKYMIPLFENINYNIIETKFIKIYNNFSKDRSLLIRKTSCSMLPIICKTILNNNNEYNKDTNIKKEELISNNLLNIFFNFTEDSNKEIQNCALGIFGEFISYLDNDTIKSNPKLLTFYLERVKELYNTANSRRLDSAPLYQACYSFPSVILTYCKKIKDKEKKKANWALLKPIYIKFIKSKDLKIKDSIASSFGEISSILNDKIVEKELAPLIMEMYINNGIHTKNIIISIIPQHLMHIKNPKVRMDFLNIYKKGFVSIRYIRNWRAKLSYIKGIKKLGNLFDNDIVFNDLVGMIIQMCFDPYNVIRIHSIKILSLFLLKFLLLDSSEKNEKELYLDKSNKVKSTESFNSELSDNINDTDNIDYKQNAIIILNCFGTCKHYHFRQLYIYLCKKIMTNEQVFNEYAFDLFNDLSYDKIVNTRISLGTFISKIWNKNKKEYDWIKKDKNILKIIYRLKNDKENDVKKTVEKIEIIIDVIENKKKVLESKKVNKKFNNEFKEFKKMFNYDAFLGKTWLKKK